MYLINDIYIIIIDNKNKEAHKYEDIYRDCDLHKIFWKIELSH